MFKGEAVRADLVDRFNIAATQATKDFNLYRELAPNNITYDPKQRLHKRGTHFTPLFDYDAVRTLATISQGYGDGFTGKVKPPLACEAPYHLNKPNLSIVAKVTEAIHKGKALRITYVSLSSGETTRDIVPHTLVDNELELVPHPRIEHSEAIELDYGMTGGVLKVEIRAATAGYLLRLWNVDCSTEHSLMGFEYQLWLRNSQALYGVTNLNLAPGRTG